MYETLSRKLLSHYCSMQSLYEDRHGEGNRVTPFLDRWAAEHPDADVWELKAAQYRLLAEHLEPIVFPEMPYYFITDLFFRDGTALMSAGGWLQNRNRHIFRDACPAVFDMRNLPCCGFRCTDECHFCFPVVNVLHEGLKGGWHRVQKAKNGADDAELRFLKCAETGLLAARRIAERFACRAAEIRKDLTDPAQVRNMDMLIASASRVPWEPPATFFEGLNTVWFCRDVLGVIDGIGNSHLGRPDLDLIGLYRADIAAGRLTKEEAEELVRIFLLIGDRHYDHNSAVELQWKGSNHEMEMGLVLGGCDSEGRPVYNELTRIFLRAHRDVGAVYPKLHCRYGSGSPDAYLEDLAEDFAIGRSVLGLSNDDAYIPALLHDGLSLADARNYVNTGCWSSISEGNESVPGANYFYLVNLMEQMVYGPHPGYAENGLDIRPWDGAADFEDLYARLLHNCAVIIRMRTGAIGKYGPLAAKVNPLALSSVFLNGCIETRRDFTQGGARYNRNTIDISGFANAVDALLAMKKICFDEKRVGLGEYLNAVRHNWEGHSGLLYAVRHCPHFGDMSGESRALADRFHRDLYALLDGERNERGGKYALNFYVYREFVQAAARIRATPDGRRDGDVYALGIGPSRCHPADPFTSVILAAGSLDPELANVSALDLVLPTGIDCRKVIPAVLRTAANAGVKHLQLNVIDRGLLLDADRYPEKHDDLVVRVCGFSAKFTVLDPLLRRELIDRASMA